LVWEVLKQWYGQCGRGAVVEYEEVAMVKSCHGVGLRVVRDWGRYLVSLVK
jgi:hypothetical protein